MGDFHHHPEDYDGTEDREAEGASFIPVRADDDLPTDEEIVKSLVPKWPPNC